MINATNDMFWISSIWKLLVIILSSLGGGAAIAIFVLKLTIGKIAEYSCEIKP